MNANNQKLDSAEEFTVNETSNTIHMRRAVPSISARTRAKPAPRITLKAIKDTCDRSDSQKAYLRVSYASFDRHKSFSEGFRTCV